MGAVYGQYWKTNDEDIRRFAQACSTVLKQPERTDEELLAVAEVYDDLMAGRDVKNYLRRTIIKKYQSITENRFQPLATNFYQNPWAAGVNKGQVFREALLDRAIDLEHFDPYQKWQLEPGIDTPVKKFDLEKLKGSRGASCARKQSSRSPLFEARKRSLAIKKRPDENRHNGRTISAASKELIARIKKRKETSRSVPFDS